jgi:hypothetical protein
VQLFPSPGRNGEVESNEDAAGETTVNGELAQLVALSAHGNAALAGHAAEWDPENSVFRFVNAVRFVGPSSEASDCTAWWNLLKNDGISRLCLVRVPPARRFPGVAEHHEVAFAGGLAAGILAQSRGNPRQIWRAYWQVTEPNHPNRAIWSIEYRSGDVASLTSLPAWPSLDSAAAALAGALRRIRTFAGTQELESWTPWFDQALALLSSPEPVPPTHPDLLPAPGYSLAARQILAAAVRGWVFGGMGSWNDADIPDPAYESVTRDYFEAVMNGIVAAVNSFEPA